MKKRKFLVSCIPEYPCVLHLNHFRAKPNHPWCIAIYDLSPKKWKGKIHRSPHESQEENQMPEPLVIPLQSVVVILILVQNILHWVSKIVVPYTIMHYMLYIYIMRICTYNVCIYIYTYTNRYL